MSTAVIISFLVPAAAGAALLAGRSRLPRIAADIRGIALQTVIIIVVLLAIAGAVAGVLLTRGGEAVSELEEADVTIPLSQITNEALCDAAGGTWTSASTTCAP